MVVHVNNLWNDHRRRAEAVVDVRPSIFQKLVAIGRYVFYRRVTVPPLNILSLSSSCVLALLLASFAFLTALVFAVRPFYDLIWATDLRPWPFGVGC